MVYDGAVLHAGWALLLQHPCSAACVCRLLCVSQGMEELVHCHAGGLLSLAPTAACKPASLEAWLRKHGQLLRSLRLLASPPLASSTTVSACEQHEVTAHAARGLAACASRQGAARLALRSLQCSAANGALLCVLQPYLSAHMRELELGPFCRLDGAGATEQWGAALAALPALSTLALHLEAADVLLPALRAATQLATLRLQRLPCGRMPALRDALPPQLRSLEVLADPDFTSWARKRTQPLLSHLTALSALTCTGEGLFPVQPNEVLPPGLRRLVITDCPRALPLALARLEVLVMQASTMRATELAQLPALLPRLRDVQLSYDRADMEAIAAAAPGWPALRGLLSALKLRVYPGPLPAQALQHMAHLGITRLAISGFNVAVGATAAEFCAVLSTLQDLHELKLGSLRLQASGGESPDTPGGQRSSSDDSDAGGSRSGGGSSDAGMSSSGGGGGGAAGAGAAGASSSGNTDMLLLMRCITALPALHNLSLHSFMVGGKPVQALAAATRLTALRLNECDVRSEDLSMLAGSLTQLSKLTLNFNFQLKMKRLRALSRLTRLRELQVCCGCPNHEALLAELQEQLPLLRVSA